jgi:cardiolipin synthase (CMP-forming)
MPNIKRSPRTSSWLRELLLPPALLSWLRLPLAACFPFVMDRPVAAIGVLLAAGVSDVLDGWVARRYGLATATGAALDPIADKLFVFTVIIALMIDDRLSLTQLLLLGTRELGELPLVIWYAVSHRARSARSESPKANFGGKLATGLQFVSIAWALVGQPGLNLLIALAAISGALAAVSYWRRAYFMTPGGT